MGKIICIIGKSSSGKDTIYNKVMKEIPDLHKVITYTTRPMRTGEVNGQEYNFVDENEFQRLKKSGKIIEDRAYDTVEGIWRYFTVDDAHVDLAQNNYCIIGTLEMCKSLRNYYGVQNVVPIFISVDDGERLFRALERERKQEHPKYKELCRRFLADAEDFTEERINEIGIAVSFENRDINECTYQVERFVMNILEER